MTISTVSEKGYLPIHLALEKPADPLPAADDKEGYQDQIFKLMAQVLADISLIMKFVAKNNGLQSRISDASLRASKGTEETIDKKIDDMEAERARMAGIAKFLKGFGIAITVIVAILTFDPEMPVSSAIMVGMTAIIASGGFDQNGYITTGVINPLSKSLQDKGMSKEGADFLAKFIVMIAVVVVTAGGGAAADSKMAGKAAEQAAADGVEVDAAAEVPTFATRFAGNSQLMTAQTITSTNMMNDALSATGMDKKTAMILSAIFNAIISFGLNYRGGQNLAKGIKGDGEGATLWTQLQKGARAGLAVGQTVQGTYTIMQGQNLQAQAETTKELARANADYALFSSWGEMNSSQSKATSSSLKRTADQLQAAKEAARSLTQIGDAEIKALTANKG